MTREQRSDYNKAWRIKHLERLRAKEADLRALNREALRLRSQAWRKAHPDTARNWSRARYHAKRAENILKKRAYNKRNREAINAKTRAYEAANRDKKLARMARYRDENRESLREKNRQYSKANPDKVAAAVQRRNAAKRRAMPPWVNTSAVNAFYKRAAQLTKDTGIKHHVDHIIPLRHRLVCGLHVPDNLRVITEEDNCRKGNSFVPVHKAA